MSLEALRHRPRVPRPYRKVACDICGQYEATTEDRFTHPYCMGKPMLCDCGQPSIPQPNCATCKGSGRVAGDLKKGEICYLCAIGPCVSCVMNAMLAHVRAERGVPA